MNTGEFFKDNENNIYDMYCSTRSLKKEMRKNYRVMCQTKEFSKKPHEKIPLVDFPACQYALNIYILKDVDGNKEKNHTQAQR